MGRRPVLVRGPVLARPSRKDSIIIDFRYHLVSIIAIFLALAVGVVVGTTALNGPVLEGLRRSNSGLIGDKRALESEVRDLQTDVGTADDLVRAKADALVGGELSGQRVLLVQAPGAETRVVEQVGDMVRDAGGAVTGRLRLEPALLEPESTQLVEDLLATVVPAGVDLPEGSAARRAGAVLGAVLLQQPDGDAPDADAAAQVVPAFEEAELVSLEDAEDLTPATLAVLVADDAPDDQEERDEDALEALLDIAAELDARSAGAVVAGPAASVEEGGLVHALRGDGERDGQISTVDNADRAVGQVAVVLALREQLQGGAGRYGARQGASGPVPTGEPADGG
ncbi:MAG TPA: copper transporter [Mycobacteriales bacterium]|nr:copper transporter [Mycobacteriales bacterium]